MCAKNATQRMERLKGFCLRVGGYSKWLRREETLNRTKTTTHTRERMESGSGDTGIRHGCNCSSCWRVTRALSKAGDSDVLQHLSGRRDTHCCATGKAACGALAVTPPTAAWASAMRRGGCCRTASLCPSSLLRPPSRVAVWRAHRMPLMQVRVRAGGKGEGGGCCRGWGVGGLAGEGARE